MPNKSLSGESIGNHSKHRESEADPGRSRGGARTLPPT
jgi:hypothetical protein